MFERPILIVGVGIVGCVIARELVQRGKKAEKGKNESI